MKPTGFALAAVVAFGSVGAASAQNHSAGWTYTISPYVWASGIEGRSGLGGLPPQDIDLSFNDVLDNLDLSLSAMIEMRRDRLSFSFDYFYASLGTSVMTPQGVAASTINVSSTTQFGTLLAGYSYVDTSTTTVDIVGGARIWDADTTFNFAGGALDGRSPGDGDTWIDPMIGAKFRHEVSPSVYVAGWGMIGGFGVASDSVWDAMLGVGYEFNSGFSVFGGYRSVSVDYNDNGFVWDVTQEGPILSASFRF